MIPRRSVRVGTLVVLAAASFALLLCGCGDKKAEAPAVESIVMQDKPKSKGGDSGFETGGELRESADTNMMSRNRAPGRDGAAAPARFALPRKLVFNADVQIIVTDDNDLDKARGQLRELIKKNNAIITQEDTSGTTGVQRTGRWTIRVPVERFDAFLDALSGIGIVDRLTKKSQDVSEEYYDLEGRIKQKKVELDNVTKIMNKAAEILEKDPKAKMEDYLAIEKRWEEVKSTVERMEGRLKLLTNLTDLTTVTLTIQERKNYVPPTAPTFGGRIGQTFGDSVEALKSFGQGLVLFGVGLGPWLPVIAIVVIPAWLLIRRLVRRARTEPAIVTAVALDK